MMGIFKKQKPKLNAAIGLNITKPEDLEYYCKTSVIDRIRCKRANIDFDETIADMLESTGAFYFVVKKNLEYDILSGIYVEPFLEKHKITEMKQSKKALICINHYINSLR